MAAYACTNSNDAYVVYRYNNNLSFFEKGEGCFIEKLKEEGCLTEKLNDSLLKCISTYINNNIIMAIDAPLGWPKDFKRLISRVKNNVIKEMPKVIRYNSNLYFRLTERFIKQKFREITPKSAPGDTLGSAAIKAAILINMLNSMYCIYCPPFDRNFCYNKRSFTIIEVYPSASKESADFKKLNDPDTNNQMSNLNKSDIADAKHCAMTAVCYAKTIGLIDDTEYPDVYTPDDAKSMGYSMDLIRNEGWIFAPKPS